MKIKVRGLVQKDHQESWFQPVARRLTLVEYRRLRLGVSDATLDCQAGRDRERLYEEDPSWSPVEFTDDS